MRRPGSSRQGAARREERADTTAEEQRDSTARRGSRGRLSACGQGGSARRGERARCSYRVLLDFWYKYQCAGQSYREVSPAPRVTAPRGSVALRHREACRTTRIASPRSSAPRTRSVDQAIRNGIARASQTLRNLDWFEVTQVRPDRRRGGRALPGGPEGRLPPRRGRLNRPEAQGSRGPGKSRAVPIPQVRPSRSCASFSAVDVLAQRACTTRNPARSARRRRVRRRRRACAAHGRVIRRSTSSSCAGRACGRRCAACAAVLRAAPARHEPDHVSRAGTARAARSSARPRTPPALPRAARCSGMSGGSPGAAAREGVPDPAAPPGKCRRCAVSARPCRVAFGRTAYE